jgi:3-deoxy-manno-octulosonate cytidylyltransferase (CMP-KDO synthetase)
LKNKHSAPIAVGIIPVRYGSTRLPGKPLLKIAGKAIIEHVYERARRASLLRDIIVATDDERIAAVVRRIGGKVVITPTAIQSGSDRVAYAAKTIDADIVVNIQGDEPLIEPEMIDETVQTLFDDETVEVGTPVRRITSAEELGNPSVVKVVLDKNNFALYFSRSPIPYRRSIGNPPQGNEALTDTLYYKHIGLYVYRKDFLGGFTQWEPSPLEKAEELEQLRILEHGHRIKCVVTGYDSFSVDTPGDFERLEKMILKS